MEPIKPLFYTVKQLGEIIPIGKNSLYKLVNRKDFPKKNSGRTILIPVSALEKFLEENTVL